MENEDKEGLKNMFSPNALKEAKDIDGGEKTKCAGIYRPDTSK